MKIATLGEIQTIRREMFRLRGDMQQFFGGDLPVGFKMLLWSLPSQGKSTFSLLLSAQLANYGRGLYCALEESIETGSIAQRARKLRISAQNIDVVSAINLPETIKILQTGKYTFCVIDSVGMYEEKPEQTLMQLKKTFPKISFIFVAHSRKDGKNYAGARELKHLCDISLTVNARRVSIEKNWFGKLTEAGDEFNLNKYLA